MCLFCSFCVGKGSSSSFSGLEHLLLPCSRRRRFFLQIQVFALLNQPVDKLSNLVLLQTIQGLK
ncbi:MAG: hypothetical protein ACK56I_09630, partial [bacterium]